MVHWRVVLNEPGRKQWNYSRGRLVGTVFRERFGAKTYRITGDLIRKNTGVLIDEKLTFERDGDSADRAVQSIKRQLEVEILSMSR
jgi:hypothetical protein